MWNRAPPYSPDLNPIEEVWAVMKKIVLKKRCQTWEELQEAVNQFVRRKLIPEPCQKYISNSE
jgi:transposase